MPTLRGISDAGAAKILVAATVALLVTGCIAFAGLQVSHEYTASIGLIGTISRPASPSDSTSLSTELPAVAQGALTDDAIADIESKVHPYSAIASKLFPKWTTSRLRSDLTVENVYSGATIGAVSLVFTGNNRERALAVTSAAADLLIKPRAVPQVELPSPEPPVQVTPTQPNRAPVPQAAAPAPIVPSPVEPANDAIQLKAIKELRGQLAMLANSSQELEAQISTETDSVTAIEQEKEHIRESVLAGQPAPKPVPIATPPDPARIALQAKLSAYQKVLAALRDRYTEDYPDVINARERVEELQAEIAQLPRPAAPAVERREPPRPASDVPQRLMALNEREKPMETDLEQMRTKLKANETKSASMRRLLMTLPERAEIARTPPAVAAPPAPASPAVKSRVEPAPNRATNPTSARPIESKFSVVTPAAIRSTEQVFSPEAIVTVSVMCGLGTGFAYLALATGRRPRKPREEAEPQQATV